MFPGPRIRNITIPTLIPYFPAHPNGTAIIFCPGGAYVHEHMGSANHFARYFLGKNITVFILKYRLHGSQDVKQISLEDGKRAVQVVRSRAAEWHLNPQRIGLAGESAGANVALHVLSAFDTATTGTNDTNAMSSRPDFVVLLACWAGKEVVSPYPLPKDSPPVFLCHADDDMTAPAALSESIVQTLSSYGVPARLFTVPTGGHGAFFLGTNPPATAWPNTFLPWLENLKLLDNGSPLQPE